MMSVSSLTPTIAQTLAAINNPAPTKIGSVDADANSMSIPISTSPGAIGSSCGSSVDTYA